MKHSKKIVVTSLIVIAALVALFSLVSLANMIGDVNGDNKMDNEDVVEILNDIVGSTSHVTSLVDMNGDSTVDVRDAITLKTWINEIQQTADGWCAGIY